MSSLVRTRSSCNLGSAVAQHPFFFFFFLMIRPPPRSTLFPYPTLFRSSSQSVPRSRAAPDRELSRPGSRAASCSRSEEHTSELQSQSNLVCRLLLEKKKTDSQYLVSRTPPHRHPGSRRARCPPSAQRAR